MLAVYASSPTITLVPSNPWSQNPRGRPKERDINRETLLEVAPDRETLLFSSRTITQLRQTLKIRVEIGATENHWLYRNRTRANSLRDGNTPISTLLSRPSAAAPNEPTASSNKEVHVLRRVVSASARMPFTQPMRLDSPTFFPCVDQDRWGTVTLSTTEKLISPRPLGPTHILTIHSMPGPSRVFQSVKGGGRKTLRRKKSLLDVVEIPINDLLFVLNVPNLTPTVPILPPRLHKELPRVLMYVPHMETFPELVVYLHNQNQAELIRKLVPEWIRDLMHPLPEPADISINSIPPLIVKTPLQLLGLLIPGIACTAISSMVQYDPQPRVAFKRTIVTVAEEVAQVGLASSSHEKGKVDPILAAVAQLNALRDNLEYIGYFSQDLWHELDVYRVVLVRAVSCQAKIRADVQLED